MTQESLVKSCTLLKMLGMCGLACQDSVRSPSVQDKSFLADALVDVNVSASALQDAVVSSIKHDHPVWFACDHSQSFNWQMGIMDSNLHNTKSAYGFECNMNKAERIDMGNIAARHAMVITAVHLDPQGKPVRYKVENSWNKEKGVRWCVMSSKWFNEYVFQVVIPKRLAQREWTDILVTEVATMLRPWDAVA